MLGSKGVTGRRRSKKRREDGPQWGQKNLAQHLQHTQHQTPSLEHSRLQLLIHVSFGCWVEQKMGAGSCSPLRARVWLDASFRSSFELQPITLRRPWQPSHRPQSQSWARSATLQPQLRRTRCLGPFCPSARSDRTLTPGRPLLLQGREVPSARAQGCRRQQGHGRATQGHRRGWKHAALDHLGSSVSCSILACLPAQLLDEVSWTRADSGRLLSDDQGMPGIGKTTSIHCLAHALLGDAYKEGVLELNASDERCVSLTSNPRAAAAQGSQELIRL